MSWQTASEKRKGLANVKYEKKLSRGKKSLREKRGSAISSSEEGGKKKGVQKGEPQNTSMKERENILSPISSGKKIVFASTKQKTNKGKAEEKARKKRGPSYYGGKGDI